MANMGYCRFENTLHDLADCWAHLDAPDLSDAERRARRRLIMLAVEIALNYGQEVDREVETVKAR